MKKSIFLFFAAILCAIGANAATKTIYFKSQQWWHKDNAASAAYYWGTGGEAKAWPGTRMTKVAGETNMWSIEIDTDKYQNIIFIRVNGSGTVQDWGAKTTDQAIPTDDKNFFTLGNSEVWGDPGATGTWSTYTPPTEPVIPEYYITGTLAGGWTGNEVKMTYNETTKIHSHTFTAVAAGEEKKFKVTDGTWDANWGGDAVSPAIEGVTKDGDGNAVFTLSTGGDVTITFDGTNIQLTTTGSFTPVETFDYYVVGSFNGWNTADAAYGMTKEGDVYKKEVTFAKDAQFKVCNGTWGAAWGAQNLGDNKYKELDGTDNIVMNEEKTFTIIFNPAQNLLTFEGLTPEAVVKYDYYLIGTINSWALKDANYGMTDEDADGVYEKEVTLAAGGHEIKVNNGAWEDDNIFGYDQLSVKYEGVSRGSGEGDNNIVIELTENKTITVKFDKNAKKITLDGLTEKAPEPTFDYYIVGSFNGDDPKKAENGMTLDGTVYKATVTLAAGDNTLKVTDGTWENTWGYGQLGAAYEEVSDAGEYNNIKITLAAEKEITVIFDATGEGKITFEGLTEAETETLVYYVEVPEGTEDCYIAGQMNGWEFVRMTQVDATHWTITYDNVLQTTEYKYACQKSWEYQEQKEDGGYVENRTWTALDRVEKWGKPVIVTYQLKGVGGWEQPGIELVQNPGNDKEYMLTCQAISATDAIKVVRLEDGVIKDYYGNGTVKDAVEVTVNYDGDGNITLPEGTYNFYFDTNEPEKKLWIEAATDCQTVTEITLTEGDNSSALATEGVVTVTVDRDFEKGKLYTIALPFTINTAASVFGNGTVVYNFANLAYDKTNEEYILGFTKVSKIEAGKPYLIEPGLDVNGFVAENVTLSSATSVSKTVKVDNVEKTATMTAVLSKTTTGGSYWLAEDRYLYNGEVNMPALRALFVLPTTPSGMPARARVALKEDAATGVEDLFTTDAPVKVIQNGQLIIIRDGVKYNVQGQVIR